MYYKLSWRTVNYYSIKWNADLNPLGFVKRRDHGYRTHRQLTKSQGHLPKQILYERHEEINVDMMDIGSERIRVFPSQVVKHR